MSQNTASDASPSAVRRFGPFEVDLRTRELRKNGVKVKLQYQPFQILQMLLDRAVHDAYGWEYPLDDDEVLARLLALNILSATA